MSIFSDLDLKNAPNDPNAAPVGAWVGTLTEITTFDGKTDPQAKFMKFVWVHNGGLGRFEDVLQLPDGREKDKDIQRKSRIKQRLLWLEVPEDRMDELTPDDLIGTTAALVTRQNGQYTNLVSLRPHYGETSTESAPTPTVADSYDYMKVFE
jgi:hypothetical protein